MDLQDFLDLVAQFRLCQADASGENNTHVHVLLEAALTIFQDGLVGNRAIQPQFWFVLCALGSAFPLLIGPHLEAVRKQNEGCKERDLAMAYILKGINEGSICEAIIKLRTQPHIFTAYNRSAPLRDARAATEICISLQSLEGLLSLPHVKEDPEAQIFSVEQSAPEASTQLDSPPLDFVALRLQDETSQARAKNQPLVLGDQANLPMHTPQIEQRDKSEGPDGYDTETQSRPASVLGALGRIGQQVGDHLPARFFQLRETKGEGQEEPHFSWDIQSDMEQVTVDLIVKEGVKENPISVKLSTADIKEPQSASGTGVAKRAQEIVSDAVNLAWPPTGASLQWLRDTTSYLPGMPFKGLQSGQIKPNKPSRTQDKRIIHTGTQDISNSTVGPDVSQIIVGGVRAAAPDFQDTEDRGRDEEHPADDEGDSAGPLPELTKTDTEPVSVQSAAELPDRSLSDQEHDGVNAAIGSLVPSAPPHKQGVASTESDNGAKEEEQKLENGPAVKWGLWGYLRPNNEKELSGVQSSKKDWADAHNLCPGQQSDASHTPAAALREEGLELNGKLLGFAQHLLDSSLAEGPLLHINDRRVSQFAKAVVQFLEHGLLSDHPQSIPWIPGWRGRARSSVLEVLQEVDQECITNVDIGSRPTSNNSLDNPAKEWVLGKLLEQHLGQILLLLQRNTALLEKYYHREALIRQEVSGKIIGLLVGLDGAKFVNAEKHALHDDRPEGNPSKGLWNTVGQYFKASNDQKPNMEILVPVADGSSQPLTGRRRKRVPRSVEIAKTPNIVQSPMSNTPDGFLTPNASLGLLSPLSSTELSAEPLSPRTMAFFKRLHQLAPDNDVQKSPTVQALADGSFTPQFLAEVLSKLPNEDDSGAQKPLEHAPSGHSNFLDTLLVKSEPGKHTRMPSDFFQDCQPAHQSGEITEAKIMAEREDRTHAQNDQHLDITGVERQDLGSISKSQSANEVLPNDSALSWDALEGSIRQDEAYRDSGSLHGGRQDCFSGQGSNANPVQEDTDDLTKSEQNIDSLQATPPKQETREILEREHLPGPEDTWAKEEDWPEQRITKRIKLITQPPDMLPIPEALIAQDHRCAGCEAYLQQGNSRDFQMCHYTGALYCQNCHSNCKAVLPANVLAQWNFEPQSVSNMAKEYLTAIHEQPVLRIFEAHAGLSQDVRLLEKAYEYRLTASKALKAASKSSENGAIKVKKFLEALGMHRHLLETADTWSLQDLVEISKGPQSELIRWLEKGSNKAKTIATSALLGKPRR